MVIPQSEGVTGCVDIAIPKSYLGKSAIVEYTVYDDVSKQVVIPAQIVNITKSNFVVTNEEISFDGVPMIFCRIELRKFENPTSIVVGLMTE